MAYHSGGSEMGVSHSRNRLCNSDKGTSNKHQHNNIRNNGCSNSNNSIHPPPPSSPSNHTLKGDDGGEDPNRKLRVKKENLQAELPLSWIQTHKSSSSSSFLRHRRHRHVNNTVQSLLEPPNIKQEAIKVEDKFSSTENEKEAVSSSKRKKKRSRSNRTLFAHKKKKTKMASKSGSKSSKSSQAKLDTLFPKTTTRSNEKEESEEQWEEFAVEEVLGVRYNVSEGPRVEFLIKWDGYGPEWNSWEPEEGCDGCPTLVQNFWKNYANQHNKPHAPKLPVSMWRNRMSIEHLKPPYQRPPKPSASKNSKSSCLRSKGKKRTNSSKPSTAGGKRATKDAKSVSTSSLLSSTAPSSKNEIEEVSPKRTQKADASSSSCCSSCNNPSERTKCVMNVLQAEKNVRELLMSIEKNGRRPHITRKLNKALQRQDKLRALLPEELQANKDKWRILVDATRSTSVKIDDGDISSFLKEVEGVSFDYSRQSNSHDSDSIDGIVSCLDGGDDEQRPREKRRKGQKRKRSDGGDDKEEYDEEDSHPYTLRKRGKKGSPTSKVALPPPDHLIVQQSTEEMDAEGVRQRKEESVVMKFSAGVLAYMQHGEDTIAIDQLTRQVKKYVEDMGVEEDSDYEWDGCIEDEEHIGV